MPDGGVRRGGRWKGGGCEGGGGGGSYVARSLAVPMVSEDGRRQTVNVPVLTVSD